MLSSDYTWGAASGPRRSSCHLIGHRSPVGVPFDATNGDSWVLESRGSAFHAHLKKEGWYTDLWRSEAGLVYVTDAGGFIQQTSAPSSTEWSTHTIPGMLVGVWGLDDEHVYAWGVRGKAGFMVRWDGKSWDQMPSPNGGIVAVHGIRPDLLVAVGDRGLIARWDGSAWTNMAAPGDEPLRAVHVVSEDEIWACGNRGGLIQGTARGWTEVLRHGAPLGGVARFAGDLWVGAYGDAGLCKLNGTALDSIKGNITGVKLEAHAEAMLFHSVALVGDTEDGESFKGYGVKGLVEMLEKHIPRWA